MASKFKTFKNRLFQPIDCSSLGLFRFFFGLTLIFQSFIIFDQNFILENFINNYYHFPHPLFEFLHLPKLQPAVIQALFLILGISSVGICTGIFFRFSSVLYFFSFSYIFLYEKAIYNAHYYLIIIIVFWFILIQAHNWPNLPTFRCKKENETCIPYWQLWVLKFQFLIVYFYGGLSKLNIDWLLYGEPVFGVIANKTLFGVSLNSLILAQLISYAGLFIDLLLPIFLIFNKWKPLCFAVIILFNVSNHWLFEGDIGVFPYIMIAAISLFLDPRTSRLFCERFLREKKKEDFARKEGDYRFNKAIYYLLIAHITFQLLFPLRHWLYKGDVRWTYEGARYSWFLKVNAKKVRLNIFVIDPKTKQVIPINHKKFLTSNQLWMDNIPDMFYQFIQYLKIDLKESSIENPTIRVFCKASLNNRPYQDYFNVEMDYNFVEASIYQHSEWIMPFNHGIKPLHIPK